MRIFLKHIIRNIKENVGRTFLIMISLFGVGILLSVSLGITFAAKSIWNAMANSIISGGYDYTVGSTTEEEINVERIKNVNVEFDYLGISNCDYGYIKNDKEKFISTPLLGLDINQSFKMEIIELKDEKKKNIVLNDNEIIISSNVADKYKLKENSKIQYYDENGNVRDLIIKYIAKDSGIFLQGISFVSNEQTFLKIIGQEEMSYDLFLLKYLGNKTIPKLTEELNNIEEDYGMDFMEVQTPSIYVLFGYSIKIGIVVLILVLIVVYFTLNSIVKIIISERIPIIGTFRSVGASSTKMNLILLLEMACYGIFSGILSALTGVALYKALNIAVEMMQDSLGISLEMTSFGIDALLIVVLTIVMLVLFQIGLSISEILKSSKLSIKDCIFNKHESIYKYSISKLMLGFFFLAIGIVSLIFSVKLNFIFCIIGILSLFVSIALLLPSITKYFSKLMDKAENPVWQMAKNTMINNKLQINTNVIVAVMMCVASLSFALLNYSVNNYKDKLDMVKSDLYVSSSQEPVNVIEDIRAIDNVERASILYTADLAENYDSITFANNKVDKLILLYSDNYKTLLEDSNTLELDADLADNLSRNEMIVSEYFKEKYNLKIGDIVVINAINKEERFNVEIPLNLKVVGFADTSRVNHRGIILSKDIVEDTIYGFSKQQYFIQTTDNKNIKDVRNAVVKTITYNAAEVYSQKEYVDATKASMKEIYKYIVIVILIIIGVALIGIINNQTVSFFERKKEMAILYSTSMSRNQLNKMIFIEAFLSYFISAIVSIVFTAMLIKLLKYTMAILGIYIPISFSIASILVLLFIIGIIMLIIYLVMKRKIKKMNIVEELKYE